MALFKKHKTEPVPPEDTGAHDTSVGTAADVEAVMKKYDRESNTRVWEGLPKLVIRWLMVAFSAYCIIDTVFLSTRQEVRLPMFVGLILLFGFLTFPAKKGDERVNHMPWYDIVLLIAGPGAYFFYAVNAQNVVQMSARVMQNDLYMIIGLIGILALVELCRRCVGLPILCVAGVLLVYTFFNLGGSADFKMTLYQVIRTMFYTFNGIFGGPISVCAKFIVVFIIFGAFLERTGIAQFFINLANAVAGAAPGGPAKVAVISSALCGMVSGSSVGNTVTTGSVTIPMMKKTGYKPEFAGAVEAAASTGGQIMPPVMGAAAFMMAELCGVSYLEVAKAALLPALLYYLALWVMIHFEARRRGLGLISSELVPSLRSILGRLYFLAPLAILVAVMIDGRSAAICANMATGSILLLSFLRRDTRFTLKRLFDTLYAAAASSLMVVACCAASGIVVGVINYTGIGFKFINVLTGLADGHLFIMLLLLMVTSFILGMGMPTTPAYIVVATLGAPALIRMGLAPLVAHMFCFYYAILSFITPPVCVAAYAGANIAEADPMKTGFTSMKLGVVAFIVPVMFVYEPSLLWQGSLLSSATATVTAVIGVIGLSGALQNWLLRTCTLPERLLLLIGGLSLFYPGLITDLIGFACMGFVITCQHMRNRKDPVPEAGEECALPEE